MVRTLLFHCCGPGFNTVSRRAVWPGRGEGGKAFAFQPLGFGKWGSKMEAQVDI